jgi:intein-encoded DNA endonuclease-like protein
MPIKKEFDKTFFKKWSPDMAYILGFLFADGNIIKTKRNTHFVALYTADYHLLFSMRRRMGSDHKISERTSDTGSVYVVQIGSRELFDDLIRLGLTPNKARRMQLPKIPKKYVGDFVRGYFDGDGCIWSGLTHAQRRRQTDALLLSFTSASHYFLSGLLDLLKARGILGGSLFRSKKGNFSRLSFSTLDSLKIYKIMYNEPTELFLPRKKLVFENFIQMRP